MAMKQWLNVGASFGILLLMGCTTTEQLFAEDVEQSKDVYQTPSKRLLVSELTLHQHTEQLVTDMLSNSEQWLETGNVAVGTFLASSVLSNTPQSKHTQALALQLQDSITSVLTQRNFPIVEFKTTTAIRIEKNADVMLSRELSKLKQIHDIKYFVTGTYNQTDTGYFINARLIDTDDNAVKAATSYFVPINVMFEEQQTQLRDGMIYRGTQQ
jgi:TolB-like protein